MHSPGNIVLILQSCLLVFVNSSEHISTLAIPSLMLSSSGGETESEREEMNEFIKNYTTVHNDDRITIEHLISQFIDLRQLNALDKEQSSNDEAGSNDNRNTNNVISLVNRGLLCRKLLTESLKNDSVKEEAFFKLLNIENSPLLNDSTVKHNKTTTLINHLCFLESSQYFGQYYFTQWSNSTERYLLKTILKDTLIPLINVLNILTMICLNCPVYSALSRKNKQISVWFLLAAYSILKTLHIFISDLPKLIVNLLILYGNYMTEQTDFNRDTTTTQKNIGGNNVSSYQTSGIASINGKLKNFHGIQNLGLIPCSIFTFLECVLEYTPNWIMVILVWEQIVRFIVIKRNSSSSALPNETYCPLYAYHVDRKCRQKSSVSFNSQITQQSSDFMYRIRADKCQECVNDEIVERGDLSTTSQQQQQQRQQQRQCDESYSQSVTLNNVCNKGKLSNCSSNFRVTHYANSHYQTHTNVNTDSVIDGGLTIFGAKLITITIIVLQVFLNVHSIWLHHYSNGKCEIDLEKHSPIFTYVYPYLLRVIHCSVPNFGCFIGVIVYTVYYFKNRGRNKSQPANILPKVKYDSIDLKGRSVSNDGDCDELITIQLEDNSLTKLTPTGTPSIYKKSEYNRMFRVVRIKDCSILLSCSLSPRQSRVYAAQMTPASVNSGNCDSSHKQQQQQKKQQKGSKLLKHSISFWSKTMATTATTTSSLLELLHLLITKVSQHWPVL
ncbi:unnamed protein product, partial [Trichobilharzia szidati]